MPRLRRRRSRGRPPHPDVLTPAEWRVLGEIRRGKTNREIAEHLRLSPNTVKTHVANMLAKLDLAERQALAAWEGSPDDGVDRRVLGLGAFALLVPDGIKAMAAMSAKVTAITAAASGVLAGAIIISLVITAGEDATTPTPALSATTTPADLVVTSDNQPPADEPSDAQVRTVGDLAEARSHHTATLLADGRVLVVGGVGVAGAALASTELYDPATRTFSDGGALQAARLRHTATRLADGSVVVVGGDRSGRLIERFDPLAGRWEVVGRSLAPRANHSATLLPDGRVLITGGGNSPDPATEIYDPETGESVPGPELEANPRQGPATSLLPGGRVLLVNGVVGSDLRPVASAEILDVARGTSRIIEPPSSASWVGIETKLADGRVWFSWGELFDPTAESWVAVTTEERRVAHTATLLHDGRILLAGGVREAPPSIGATTLLDPASGDTVSGPDLFAVRSHHTATRLPDGRVVLIGGSSLAALEGTSGELAPLASAEEWLPAPAAPPTSTRRRTAQPGDSSMPPVSVLTTKPSRIRAQARTSPV